jgi:hypothetical protein
MITLHRAQSSRGMITMQRFFVISVIVKKDLSPDEYLAAAVFDNTPLGRWSYGIANNPSIQ